jgi:hypothetical protein
MLGDGESMLPNSIIFGNVSDAVREGEGLSCRKEERKKEIPYKKGM